MSVYTAQPVHSAFEWVREHKISARQITVSEYRHKKTGAIHYHLAADHDESVFLVGFRTQPMDSKGAAHILEHTVLCGSEKFPVRDPFFAMMRRSLNTFMNAITATDWTIYPFATQNPKDYQNLLEIYLDAVFAPNIHPLDFAQEGIRVELEGDQAVYKGVVFNEMKGALAPPPRQLYHAIAHNLYSTTTYHFNSGGEPTEIPNLTHGELLSFYQKHYHPSNAVFMTFGRQAVFPLHEQLENLALHKFEVGECLTSKAEKHWSTPKCVVQQYAIESDTIKDKTYHSLSWLLPVSDDIETWFGLRLVAGVLLENAASPLRHYLDGCDFAQSAGPISGLNDQNYHMSFHCGVQGSNPEFAQKFAQDVEEILVKVAKQPVDVTVIESLLHQMELGQREITGGRPYGLNLFMSGLSRVIHHQDPLQIWDLNDVLDKIKQKIRNEPMWISQLIQQHLIDNPHRLQLTFVPDSNKQQQILAAEQQRLDEISAKLTAVDRQKIEQQTELLKQRQAQQNQHDVLPKVTLNDVEKWVRYPQSTSQTLNFEQGEVPLHVYAAGTNGIYYQQVLIDIPETILNSKYFSVFSQLLGQVGAGEDDYLKLQQKQTACSGGMWMSASLRSDLSNVNKLSAYLVLSTKALVDKPDAINLLKYAFTQLRFDEKSRILELLQQQKLGWQSNIINNGQHYAAQFASRYLSRYSLRDFAVSGLTAFNEFSDLVNRLIHDEQAFEDFQTELKFIHQRLCQASRQFVLVSELEHLATLEDQLHACWSDMQFSSAHPNEAECESIELATLALSQLDLCSPALNDQEAFILQRTDQTKDAWIVPTNVQFCATAYAAVAADHPDAAALMVLGPYLKNGFLHHAIREQGGAYGAGSYYDGNGCSFIFFSFRDPRLAETFLDFDASVRWLLNQDTNDEQLESAILNIISSLDKPSSPANEALTSCHAEQHGRTVTWRQNLRQQILSVSTEDLKRVAELYLNPQNSHQTVLTSKAKQDVVENLGFKIHQLS